MTRTDVLRMVKRQADLPYSTCCHTFRATGMTAFLENGGTIENAQANRCVRSSCEMRFKNSRFEQVEDGQPVVCFGKFTCARGDGLGFGWISGDSPLVK